MSKAGEKNNLNYNNNNEQNTQKRCTFLKNKKIYKLNLNIQNIQAKNANNSREGADLSVKKHSLTKKKTQYLCI